MMTNAELTEPVKNELWIGSKKGGLARCQGGNWSTSFCPTDSFSVSPCHLFAVDQYGNVWVGSEAGLTRFCRTVTRNWSLQKRLDGLRVSSLSVSENGIFAVASPGGVFFGRNKPVTMLQRPLYENAKELATVAFTDQQGVFWCGTRGGGLWRLMNQKWENTLMWGSPRAEDRGNFISALLETSDGRLWVGTSQGLMECRDPRGAMRMVPIGPEAAVKTLYEDRDGSLWCGYEADGLLWLMQGKTHHYSQADGLPGPGVLALCRDPDGVLWLGGRDGLARWTASGATRPQSDSKNQRGRWVIPKGSGLPEAPVVQVMADEAGALWLGTSVGIVRVDRQDLARQAARADLPLSVRILGREDGLPSEVCTGGLLRRGWQPSDKNLWFGTESGLALIGPMPIPPPGARPRVVLESVRANGREVASNWPQSGLDSPLVAGAYSCPPRLTLPPDSRRISISFTALDFPMPERARFRFKLDEDGWSAISAQRTATFEWLSPGRHRFQVSACSAEGVWSQPDTAIELLIKPHFWETSWFAAALALVSAACAAVLVRWRQQRSYQRRMGELEHQKELYEERARIARDLHDEIGSKLSRLSFLGALIHQAGESEQKAVQSRAGDMVSTARATLRAFENVVWAVSPRHDSLKSLANHICQYAEEYFAGSPVGCRFKIDELLPDWPLEPKVRNEIFLTVKEALNNVLKHSGANALEIYISTRVALLEIKIRDNGAGFDVPSSQTTNPVGSHGNGLPNMRSRLQAIGGSCEIASLPGTGAEVTLVLQLQCPRSAK